MLSHYSSLLSKMPRFILGLSRGFSALELDLLTRAESRKTVLWDESAVCGQEGSAGKLRDLTGSSTAKGSIQLREDTERPSRTSGKGDSGWRMRDCNIQERVG